MQCPLLTGESQRSHGGEPKFFLRSSGNMEPPPKWYRWRLSGKGGLPNLAVMNDIPHSLPVQVQRRSGAFDWIVSPTLHLLLTS